MEERSFSSAVVLFAHPDDAEFMCGGTTAKWAAAGCQVIVAHPDLQSVGGSLANTGQRILDGFKWVFTLGRSKPQPPSCSKPRTQTSSASRSRAPSSK